MVRVDLQFNFDGLMIDSFSGTLMTPVPHANVSRNTENKASKLVEVALHCVHRSCEFEQSLSHLLFGEVVVSMLAKEISK